MYDQAWKKTAYGHMKFDYFSNFYDLLLFVLRNYDDEISYILKHAMGKLQNTDIPVLSNNLCVLTIRRCILCLHVLFLQAWSV